MKKIIMTLGMLALATAAHAVPVLQIGAPGTSAGTYAPYVSGTDPVESDTAFTNGNLIYVGGVYQQNDVLQLGGAYAGGTYSEVKNGTTYTFPIDAGGGWASLGFGSFEGKGAVLVVTIPDGSLNNDGTLKGTSSFTVQVDGKTAITPFLGSQTTSYFPNNHAPVTDSTGAATADYLFFDLGNIFSRTSVNGNNLTPAGSAVPNFDGTPGDAKAGAILNLTLGISGIDWAHFDVMAIESSLDYMTDSCGNKTSKLRRSVLYTIAEEDVNNPGSHDVTWNNPPVPPLEVVPEPGTFALLGLGLCLLGFGCRKRRDS